MACKTFQRAEWNFHTQQQQQQRGGKRPLLLLQNPFSNVTAAVTPTTPTAAPPSSLLGVSKSRVNSLSQRITIPLVVQAQQHDALLAAVLPNFSDGAKKVRARESPPGSCSLAYIIANDA
jgi:hypothetical protein